jgi:hypothetical protein
VAELEDGQQRLAAEAGAIGRGERADLDLLHLLEALGHDFHVGLHDGVAELAELLHVLLVDDFAILLLRDAELWSRLLTAKNAPRKALPCMRSCRSPRSVALLGDGEAGQREDANVFIDDLLARPDGQPLPGLLAFLVRLPDQAAALLHAVERVGVGEGLGIAAENDGDVAQIAVDADAVFGGDHEVAGGRALLLGAVLGIGADVDDFLGIAEVVDFRPSRSKSRSLRSPMMAPRFLPVVMAPQPPMEWKRTATAPSGSSEGVSSPTTE